MHQNLIEFGRLKSRIPYVKTVEHLLGQNYNGAGTWRTDWGNKVERSAWKAKLLHGLLPAKENLDSIK